LHRLSAVSGFKTADHKHPFRKGIRFVTIGGYTGYQLFRSDPVAVYKGKDAVDRTVYTLNDFLFINAFIVLPYLEQFLYAVKSMFNVLF
jgi:hypothetical protein